MTDLRDLIARAIFLVDYISIGEESWETAELDGNDDRRQAFEKADAVLAVLAGLPADVIEQAARGAYDGAFLKHAPAEVDRWSDLVADNDPAVESWREVARQAFAAVFGGERDAEG